MTFTILSILAAVIVVWQAYSYGKFVGTKLVSGDSKVFLFNVEQVGNQYMAYTMEESRYIAKGVDMETATAAVRERVPGFEFYIAVSKTDEPV